MSYNKIESIEKRFKKSTSLLDYSKNPSSPDKVLIIGGAGFLGSVLTKLLVEEGHNVTVLDKFIYEKDSLSRIKDKINLTIKKGDIRDIDLLKKLMINKDTVINLAAIVGEQACRIDRKNTIEINTTAVENVVRIANEAGVKRILHTSSYIVYGNNDGGLLDENAPLLPVSLHAESKIKSEEILRKAMAKNVGSAVCIFRLSSLFGYSHRPRFDLAVNNLIGNAWNKGSMTIFGPDRRIPLLHVSDAARAIKIAMGLPPEKIAGKVFNTGGNELNLKNISIGNLIKKYLPSTLINIEEAQKEPDYRLDFTNIRKELVFTPRHSVTTGILELIQALESNKIISTKNPIYSNYKWLHNNPELLKQGIAEFAL
ncbi:NAD-dependent epimerase/dehydratase family protein [bacterium]|nr:NAD-dependent epimerase/dehydratase family protein [bacterium]